MMPMLNKDMNKIFSTGYGETFALGHEDTSTQCEFKLIQYFANLRQ